MGFKKSDIEYHHTGNGYWPAPSVNVKTSGGWVDHKTVELVAEHNATPSFVEWWDLHGDDESLNGWWNIACEYSWEELQEAATDIFGSGHTVYSSGRSGGWAFIDEFGSHDGYSYDGPANDWDAIELAKWAKFVKRARLIADDVQYQQVSLIFINVFEPEHAKAQKRAFRALLRDAS